MKALKEEFVKMILDDTSLQGEIATYNSRSAQSVVRWAKQENHKLLTSFGSLQAIAKYTGKSVKSLTTERKKQAA